VFILHRELIGRVQTAYAASRNWHKATNRYGPARVSLRSGKLDVGQLLLCSGPPNQLATTMLSTKIRRYSSNHGVVYHLISNQYTLFFKPDTTGGTSRIGGRHKIQVKLAARDNRFDGYPSEYKRQYYRPLDRARETNAITVVPSP
jgi:hypothetical protein